MGSNRIPHAVPRFLPDRFQAQQVRRLFIITDMHPSARSSFHRQRFECDRQFRSTVLVAGRRAETDFALPRSQRQIHIDQQLCVEQRADGTRRTTRYDIDLFKCIYCGFCEESCPVDSIVETHIHEYHFDKRGQNIVTKPQLLAIGVPMGAALIIGSWLLTGYYVSKANKEFDRISHELVKEVS